MLKMHRPGRGQARVSFTPLMLVVGCWIFTGGAASGRIHRRPPMPAGHNAVETGGAVCVVRCQLEGANLDCVCVCMYVGRGTPQPDHLSKGSAHSLPMSITFRAVEALTCPGSRFIWPLKNPLQAGATKELRCPLVPRRRKCRHRIVWGGRHCSPRVTQLKHVEDGVVHLDQHSQVDGQAGLAVLRGGRARQPGEGVVLLQYKPEFEKKKIKAICSGMSTFIILKFASLFLVSLPC